MKRVTGIGGIFFKAKDPQKSKDWYKKHLGISAGEYGATFQWLTKENPAMEGNTVWNTFSEKTSYFDPGKQDFMINYRVENLEALLSILQEEGVTVVGNMESYEYGKFAWILDVDGNKVELWEPIDENL